MEQANGEARTSVAVLLARFTDCQRARDECHHRLDEEIAQMDKRIAATEKALTQLGVYGTILLTLLTGVVGPIVVVLLLRHFGTG